MSGRLDTDLSCVSGWKTMSLTLISLKITVLRISKRPLKCLLENNNDKRHKMKKKMLWYEYRYKHLIFFKFLYWFCEKLKQNNNFEVQGGKKYAHSFNTSWFFSFHKKWLCVFCKIVKWKLCKFTIERFAPERLAKIAQHYIERQWSIVLTQWADRLLVDVS